MQGQAGVAVGGQQRVALFHPVRVGAVLGDAAVEVGGVAQAFAPGQFDHACAAVGVQRIGRVVIDRAAVIAIAQLVQERHGAR
ncbi:hypothetical protein G6F35_018689 [Rhizopus arrhizus]|nr:hypothetical protein G6F35_018689 [Rhizopus arrhizus]KAG1244258.1 hypothetical protein G6F65_021911 [Rhizopus arrhizus]